MRLYLTGGTGLLGSHFAELAKGKGAEVVSLVRPTSDTSHLDALGVDLRFGNLLDVGSLASGMKNCDAVIHAASPIGSWGSTQLYEQNTVIGTRNVLSAMGANAVKTLIHISTISVHGLDPIQGEPVSETTGYGQKFLPYDHYGRAKVKAEKRVKEAHESGKIQAAILRSGWMYGPRDNNSYGRLADMARLGIRVRVGNGDNPIPLVNAGNVARAIWKALLKESSDFKVYLYASDGLVTQNDYLSAISRAIFRQGGPLAIPKKVLLVAGKLQELLSVLSGYRLPVLMSQYVVHLLGSHWRIDQSRTERELGIPPGVSYEGGFAKTAEWYRKSRSLKLPCGSFLGQDRLSVGTLTGSGM